MTSTNTAINSSAGTLRGIVFLVASMGLFAMVDGLSKVLVEGQSFGQIVLARYALGLPILLAMTAPARWRTLFRTAHPGLQVARGLTPITVGGAMTIGLMYLPLAEATVILFAGPFAVVALSGPMLGEKVGRLSWIAVILGFIAVLMVVRPGLSGFSIYVLFPLLGAAFYAALQLLSRKLAELGEAPVATLAWTLAVGLVLSLPLAIHDWKPVAPGAWPLLIGLGVAFGLAQMCLVQAYRTAAANVLAPFTYTQIIAAVIFGLVVFGAVPDVWSIAGIAIIIAAGVMMLTARK